MVIANIEGENVDKLDIVDYAMPLMNIERLARATHDRCLERNYKEAEDTALKIGVEVRILIASLALMQGKETTR